MAFQPVPDTVEIQARYTLGGESLMNTYHAEKPGGYSQADIDALANVIDSIAVPTLLADQSVHINYVETYVRGLAALNDIDSLNSANAGLGGQAVQSLTATTAFCVQKLTGMTGRSARGRVYVAGVPVSYLETGGPNVGLITTSAAAALKDGVDYFRQTIAALSTWVPVIVSRRSGGAQRATGVTFEWITTSYVDRVLDQRRSRKR